jgi:magnesium transporter
MIDEQHVQQPPDARIEDATDPSPADERVAQILAHTIDVAVLASAVEQQEAADAADTLETLDPEELREVLRQMEDQAAAEALAEMPLPLAVSAMALLAETEPEYAARLLGLMAPDDAADMIQGLDDHLGEDLLARISPEQAADLAKLLLYPEKSAGGIMTTDFLALRDDMTVQQATDLIRTSDISEGTEDVLVTDPTTALVGILSLRKLLLARADELLSDLVERSVRVVRPDLDRELVAQEFDRYDYAILPVVDEQGRLLGVVTVDDVIDVMRAEQTEDVQKTVGAGGGEAVYSPMAEKIRGRLPWLVVSLAMTSIAALVILSADGLIVRYPVLPFLLPVIAALVGNAGHQALAVTLRGIVLDELRRERIAPFLLREVLVGLAMGVALGLVILLVFSGVTALRDGTAAWQMGLVAGIATAVSMGVATLTGPAVPLIMRRIGIDPAQSSAIFLIMITDGISFSVLLGLTALLLR